MQNHSKEHDIQVEIHDNIFDQENQEIHPITTHITLIYISN